MAEEGIRWLEEHAQANNVLVLLRVADNAMPVRTYDQLFPLVKIAYDMIPSLAIIGFPGPASDGGAARISSDQFAIARALSNGCERRHHATACRIAASRSRAGTETLARQLHANWQVGRFRLDASIIRDGLPMSASEWLLTMNADLERDSALRAKYRRS